LVWSLLCQVRVWCFSLAFGFHLLRLPFFYLFTLSRYLSLPVKCIHFRQQTVGSFFFFFKFNTPFFQSDILRPLTFSAIIILYLLISVIFFNVWFLLNFHLLINFSSEIYSFSYFHGCIYLSFVCTGFL
jgi:hypothetical protein